MANKVGSDIEIARAAKMLPIGDMAKRIGIPDEHLYRHGPTKAKLAREFIEGRKSRPNGRFILITAITPTPAGEGKTTTTVGLGDGLNRIGKKAIICLREPSLGPCFGVKGGAAGGGFAPVVPMEDINLPFTRPFHAIGTAHHLLSALIDNPNYWGNQLRFAARRIQWPRRMDMNRRHARLEAGGLRGDGSRLRRGSRRREVLRHQVPQGGPEAGRRGHRRHDPRPEDAWWRRQGRARQGERRGGEEGCGEPRAPYPE